MMAQYLIRWADGNTTPTFITLEGLWSHVQHANLPQARVKRGELVMSLGTSTVARPGKYLYKAWAWRQDGASDAAIFANLDYSRMRETNSVGDHPRR